MPLTLDAIQRVCEALRSDYNEQRPHDARRDREMELTARYMLACALTLDGRAEEALAEARETAALCETYGERSARGYAEWAAAVAHWTLGHLDEAERSARQALTVRRTLTDGIAVGLTTELLAWIANDRKQFARAQVLSRTAADVWRSMGTTIDAFGPQLSGFAVAHSPHQPEPSPIQRNGASPFHHRRHERDVAVDGDFRLHQQVR